MIKTIIGLALGSIFLVLGLSAQAQQPTKMARIGYLNPGDPVSRSYRTEAFRQGLKELGYIEGKNIIIEYRFAEARAERLPELARDLVRLKVDIIFAQGRPATEAAKNGTRWSGLSQAVRTLLAGVCCRFSATGWKHYRTDQPYF